MAEYFHDWLDLPTPLEGSRIVDVGAGGSNLTQFLRAHGADAYAVDPRYSDNFHPLFQSLKENLGLTPREIDVDSLLERLRGWFMRGGSTPDKNQYAFERMLVDARQHPDRYLVGRADKLPFEDESIDFVHSLEAVSAFLMDDVDELRNSVREMIRILKPGGKLQINPWPLNERPWYAWEPHQVVNATVVQRDLENSVTEWAILPSPYAETDLVITK